LYQPPKLPDKITNKKTVTFVMEKKRWSKKYKLAILKETSEKEVVVII
jgi:hypothetical protein